MAHRNTACWLALLGVLLLASARAADRPATARVQDGESVRDVAGRVLGSADLTDELLQLNQIADATQVRPGMLLALPGPERDAALQALKAASDAIVDAAKRGAEDLCAAEMQAARTAMQAADAARAAASYSKASALAGVAAARAAEAGDLAEKRASVAESARLASAAAVQTRTGKDAWGTARAGDTLAAGTAIRTGDGGAATIEFSDGSVLQLGALSEAELTTLLRDRRTGRRHQVVQLLAGELAARAAAGAGAGLELRSSPGVCVAEGAEFDMSRSSGGDTRVATRAGSVQVVAGGNTVALPSGRGLRVTKGGDLGEPKPLPVAPRLAETWSAGLTTGVARVVLTWQPVAGATAYHLQVARDPGFRDRVHEDGLNALTTVTPALPVGAYYWRVCARTPEGAGPWSGVGQFRTVFDLRARIEAGGKSVERGGRTLYAPGIAARPVPAQDATSIVRFEEQSADGSWRPSAGRVVLTEGGRHVVRFRGVSPDGRAGEPVEATLEVDDVAPGIGIRFSSPERTKEGPVVKVHLDADDSSGIAGMEARVRGPGVRSADWMPCGAELVLRGAGRHAVEVRARDALGNVAEASAEIAVQK